MTGNRLAELLGEFSYFLRGLSLLLFPPVCLGCSTVIDVGVCDDMFGLHLCPKCKTQVSILEPPFCTRCSTPFKSKVSVSHICWRCEQKPPYFDRLLSPFLYEGMMGSIIEGFKYGKTGRSGRVLGNMLGNFLMTQMHLDERMLLVPLPLHPKREKERGFNQTLILAKGVKEVVSLPFREDLVVRVKNTKSQTGLNFKERQENVKNAFVVTDKAQIKGKKILLVDDVATTGSTINECAKALKRAGAKEVIAIVIARARGEVY